MYVLECTGVLDSRVFIICTVLVSLNVMLDLLCSTVLLSMWYIVHNLHVNVCAMNVL